MKIKRVMPNFTAKEAENLRQMANLGIGSVDDIMTARETESARKALEKLVIAMGYSPQRIAGRIGFKTIDGKGSLS